MLKLNQLSLIKNKQLLSLSYSENNLNYLWLLLPAILVAFLIFSLPKAKAQSTDPTKYWDIRSIDTMKYSRDTAGAKVNDASFDAEIQTEVKNIATSGANYIAIATPYDEQFYPFLERWVKTARENQLHVWFRGNFSDWEGWFGHKRGMSLEDHTKKTVEFIKKHPDLFEEGDIFSSCPECENGAFGDPRQTGKVKEYREFMVSETEATKNAFHDINKEVPTNYWSMNLDVAKLVMDKQTTEKLGGVVVIDHYVNSPDKLVTDADELANNSGGKVMFGEFGAPIPDINGQMTEKQQADFLEKALELASKSSNIFGLNYWVSKGGSTELWNENNEPRLAVDVLSKYYNPPLIEGTITNEFGKPVPGVEVKNEKGGVLSDSEGNFTVLKENPTQLIINKEGYDSVVAAFPDEYPIQVTLVKSDKSLLEKIQLWLKKHNIVYELP